MLSWIDWGRQNFVKQILCDTQFNTARVFGIKYLILYQEKCLLYRIHLFRCGHPHPSGLVSFVGDGDKQTLSGVFVSPQSLCVS